jgi:hypothetical protein
MPGNESPLPTPRLLLALLLFAAAPALPARQPAKTAKTTGAAPPAREPAATAEKVVFQGVVLDRQGKPVAGAKVAHSSDRQRAEAATDAAGQFQLSTSLLRPAFLFVEKAGFRFHGQGCDKADRLRIVLTRRTEPATRKMTTLPPALPRARRQTLADRLMEPDFKKVLPQGKDDDRLRLLERLAELDPGRLLEELEARPLKSAWYEGYVRRAAVKQLARSTLAEARTFADSIKDPGFRTFCYLDLHDALAEGKKAERLALLNQALVHSRAVETNDHRILHLGSIARRLHAQGEKARASRLLREGQAIAKELPTASWAGYARGAFAEDLALIDRPAALALMKDLKDPFELVRHHGNLAHRLGGTEPAEAERLLETLAKPGDHQGTYQRDQYAIRVCYRMASADLPRARKLAGRIHDEAFKARAHAVMAQALARSKPKDALALLDQAYAILASRVSRGADSFNGYTDAASLGGLLLPVAEQIDPALVPEFFWRSLSFRGRQANARGEMRGAAVGSLALVLARYDREVALALLATAQPQPGGFRSENLFRAAALADPSRAAAMLAKLPAGRETDWTRQAVVRLLVAEGDSLWRAVHSAVAQWYVDDHDL